MIIAGQRYTMALLPSTLLKDVSLFSKKAEIDFKRGDEYSQKVLSGGNWNVFTIQNETQFQLFQVGDQTGRMAASSR